MTEFQYRTEIINKDDWASALRGMAAFLETAPGEALVTATYEI